MKYVLALDQGTTSSRAIVFNKYGEVVGKAQQEFKQIYPAAGWVEHEPKDILGSQIGVISEALVRAGVTAKDIEAIGVTNQRETTLVWDKITGEPVYNAIVWQCRRTADYCKKLVEDGYGESVFEKTGLIPDAYFSATKIKWILDNVKGARSRAERGELAFGTVDTFLTWHLSGGKIFATDYTNAARTMLFNIHTLQWDEELLKLFNIPQSMLPEVKPSGAFYGAACKEFVGRDIPVCGVAGDQQSALFGHLCLNAGDMKNTYGTGCFMLMNTGDTAVKSKNGLVTTLCASLGGRPQYALEGSVFVGGAAVQWLRDEMGLISNAAQSEEIAKSVPNSCGVYVVPAFTGLGAPYWDAGAKGLITGITRGTGKAHIVRATLEAVAYQVNDVAEAMQRDSCANIARLTVDGGACVNDFLMQFQADISGCRVERPKVIEATALGAAYLAGITCGYWSGTDELKRNSADDKVFYPTADEKERRKLLDGWHRAVRQARAE